MADAVERPKCGTCRYWSVFSGERVGRCKRHVPSVKVEPAITEDTNWCGEHSNLEDGRIIYLADMLAERLGSSIEHALHSGILHLRNTQ